MRRWTAGRAMVVAVTAAALALASQVIAALPPADDATDLATVTTTTTATTAPPPTTTTTEAGPPITGPVRLDETTRLDAPGIGPVEAGMTLGEAEQAAGRRFTISGREDPAARCYTATPDGLVGLRFIVQGPASDARAGRVVRVEVTDSTWATVSGARVGSTVDEVKKLYGRRLDRVVTTTTTARRRSGTTTSSVAPTGRLTVSVRTGGKSFAVAFETSETQVVTGIRSGDAAAVADLVGCG